MPLANVERHVMRIEPAERSARTAHPHYGFIFGTGVVYGFLAEYYREGQSSPVVAAKTLARGIGSTLVQGEMIRRMAKPFRGSVELDDGTTWPVRDYLTVVGATVDQIGFSFRPFYRSAEREGAFHLLGVYASPFQVVCDLPRIHRAQPMHEGRTYDATPTRAIIRSADGILRYTIDGDLHEHPGAILLSNGPKVKIVVVS
jgi:hypothetical protein